MNESILKDVIATANEAGYAILKIKESIGQIDFKSDNSPVTRADITSHNILVSNLKKIINIPILSEEDFAPYQMRQHWDEYWMIDPLDGTKEFINDNDEFCINISYMKKNMPVLAVIYAPATQELHAAIKEKGTWHNNVKLQTRYKDTTVAISRFHHSEKTQEYMNEQHYHSTICVGASLKFGRLALGQIDIYPRFQGSSEWDIAAGDLILTEAGGSIIDLSTNKPPLYNKDTMENNYFIAKRSGF